MSLWSRPLHTTFEKNIYGSRSLSNDLELTSYTQMYGVRTLHDLFNAVCVVVIGRR